MPESPDVPSDLITIFESNDRSVIGMAKGLLEDAGIPFWMQEDETAARLVLGPIMFPSCQFLVPRNRDVESRDLLGPLMHSGEAASPS